jgi:hypothetical protein
MGKDNQRKPCVSLQSLFCRIWLGIVLLSISTTADAEPLRIAYTSIAVVYGPLWVTKEAGIFKKLGIDPEFIYIAGGPPSLHALIAGDVAISFTAAGATVGRISWVLMSCCSAPASIPCLSNFGQFPASKSRPNSGAQSSASAASARPPISWRVIC